MAQDDRDALREEQQALGRETKEELARWARNWSKLSEAHRQLLPSYAQKCTAAGAAVGQNQKFFSSMVQAFEEPTLTEGALNFVKDRLKSNVRASAADADKVLYVLKNAVRDWAEEGVAERDMSYGRICSEIARVVPAKDGEQPSVLVPGCGLGRLPYMLSQLGYNAEGNEFSFYMLIAASFILNGGFEAGSWTIHPWMHSSNNHLTDSDQLRGVRLPDVSLREQSGSGRLIMSAGDFAEVYRRDSYVSSYDAVVTCFFLDCAHNIIDFVHIIFRILKEGGIWINLGPLLYHWADSHTYLPREELSIELSLEDVVRIVQAKGFQILQQTMVPATFNSNPRYAPTSQ